MIFAPTGYPEAILITNAKAPSPGILNIILIRGLNMLPRKLTTPNPINISAHIKNGNRAGHTTLNHRFRPSNEALNVSSGNMIILDTMKSQYTYR
jgi:hypothetical protein